MENETSWSVKAHGSVWMLYQGSTVHGVFYDPLTARLVHQLLAIDELRQASGPLPAA